MENFRKEEERANYYKFFAECFYLPDAKLIEVLNTYKEVVGSKYSEISEYLASDQDIEPIQIDFTKLFIGPFGLLAAPYGSVYLEDRGMLMGNSTINAEDMYAEEGIKVGIKEVPDHIAIELEFMAFLAYKKIEAMKARDKNKIEFYHQKQHLFLDIHLGNWIEEFTEKVEKNAQTKFYRKLAHFTRDFILQDKAHLLN